MLYLIPLLPFLGFLVNTTFRRSLPKSVSGGIATGAMLVAFGAAVGSVWQMLGETKRPQRYEPSSPRRAAGGG